MSDARWFIPSPLTHLPPEKVENIPHPPITTRLGRVIYNRKTHRWTDKDIQRIVGQYFDIDGERGTVPFWIKMLEKATIWMLDKILDFFAGKDLPEAVSESLYYIARDFLAKLIDRLLAKDKDRLKESVSGGAH